MLSPFDTHTPLLAKNNPAKETKFPVEFLAQFRLFLAKNIKRKVFALKFKLNSKKIKS